MMRWLLDQGIPISAAVLLRARAMEAINVSEISMAKANDHEIIDLAISEERIVVTLDSDFHAILALSGKHQPSVIRIREERLKGEAISKLILHLGKQFEQSLTKGCLITATTRQARLRLLPIHS